MELEKRMELRRVVNQVEERAERIERRAATTWEAEELSVLVGKLCEIIRELINDSAREVGR